MNVAALIVEAKTMSLSLIFSSARDNIAGDSLTKITKMNPPTARPYHP
jgi:hypothetical protein